MIRNMELKDSEEIKEIAQIIHELKFYGYYYKNLHMIWVYSIFILKLSLLYTNVLWNLQYIYLHFQKRVD